MAYGRETLALTLERELNKLRRGDDADLLKIESAIERHVNMEDKYMSLDQIEPMEGVWNLTGYQPIDEYIGGIPDSSLTIIAAPPGCLVGDTVVGVNRAGKSFKITMKDLERMVRGDKRGGRVWDKNIPTRIRSRYEDGSIHLSNIRSVLYSGTKEVYELKLRNGMSVTGTTDHPVYTEQGWKHLGSLMMGDKVWVESTTQKTVLSSVDSVIPKGKQETFDIEIDGEPHNFLANGIVVHNTGKTSLLAKLAISTAKTSRKVLFYTLEMTGGQIAKRVIDLENDAKDEPYKKNIIVCDDIMDVEEVCADAAKVVALDNYGMIGIDFADLMLTEKEEEGNVAQLYRSMARLAKKSGVPVILLSQLNRQYAEHGGIPRIQNIRWSGLAEAMAALILLIYNPNQIFGAPPAKNQSLIAHPGRGYVVVGKSRFGYKQGGVGAIDLEWDGKLSWGNKAVGWMPLTSV